MDFAYRNVTFDMKQLVEVLHCDLQVTIHEGLMETQTELLETVGSFVDHFQSEMSTLSPLQMHALLDHLSTRKGVVRSCLMPFKEEKHQLDWDPSSKAVLLNCFWTSILLYKIIRSRFRGSQQLYPTSKSKLTMLPWPSRPE